MTGIRLLSVLLHLIVGATLLPALAAAAGTPAAAALVVWLVASAVLMPMSLRRRGDASSRVDRALAWAGPLAMGAFSSLFVLTTARGLVLGALWAVHALGVASASALASAWRLDTAAAVPLLALALTVWGFVEARRPARVKSVDVPLKNLPAALHGFRIAQISDVHVGPTIRGAWIEPIVARVNALEADLVAITGDLVDGSVGDLGAHVAPLAGLRSRHGTFFVTGNHEYYSGAVPWIAELRRLGITVLVNEHVVLRHGGAGSTSTSMPGSTASAASPASPASAVSPSSQSADTAELVLAGVADWSAHHFEPSHQSDPHRAMAGAPAHATKVLLAHQPRSAAAAADAGFHLQLSGHTHGGQFLPWNLFVPMQQPFTAGLRAVRDLWVYVSRGTGYWGPPKRLGAPSEITELRLVRA
jgi:hypothetical protein